MNVATCKPYTIKMCICVYAYICLMSHTVRIKLLREKTFAVFEEFLQIVKVFPTDFYKICYKDLSGS